LLDAQSKAENFLESPAPALVATVDAPISERPGTVIGPYKLLEQVGEGGFGVVFMAEQMRPVRRKVALKVLKPGMDTRHVIARFEAERQALALMDHPNIAHVFDGGETVTGRPYFVMDLVRGIHVTQFCDQNNMAVRQRLELFITICQAIQHAHLKGIIHRDVKPTNVLVTLHDGTPVCKVIDFGIAKATGQQLTEKTLFTNFAQMIGTPLYMSPEQAQMSGLDIDTRTDIYALGVLLYELLTGTTPFDKERLKTVGYDEIRRIIREEDPPKPSARISTLGPAAATASANRGSDPKRLSQLFRGELDWIVMKALEKDRNRRYESASAFAADVQRYLHDEPVLACPPSVGYRFKKFARRNKAALATVALVIFFIVLLGGVVGWGVRDRAAREQEIAGEAARKLAHTEEGIRQALDRGTNSRAELHALLKKPGGVQELLNQPARWELFLKTAQGKLAQAQRLAVRAEGDLDAELTQAMERLEQQLTSDQADYDLARHLEKVRMDWATLVDGRFDSRKSAEEYRQAFAGFGVLNDDPTTVSARLVASPIKEQLVAALDDWAFLSFLIPQRDTAERLLALARQVAPDPVWGDRLRQLKVWRDQEALDKLMAETPPAGLSSQLYALVGWSLIPKANHSLRESWLRRGQAEHPADFWLNCFLAGTLEKTGTVEATGFYRAAIAARPGASLAHNNLGKTLWDQKKLPEALDAFHNAIALDPRHAMAHYNLGVVLAHQKKLPEAIDAFKQAIAIDPKYGNAYLELGAAFYAQGKLPETVDAYRNVIKFDPNNAKARYNLGCVLQAQRKLKEAIDAYSEAIKIDPKHACAYCNLGNALRDTKRVPEAIVAFHKAIAIDPKFVNAYYNLGLTLRAHGKLDDAVNAYRKAIEIDPKNARVYTNLGFALQTQGKLDDAIDAYRKAIKIDPKYAMAYNNLGCALEDQNKLGDAIAAYEEAIRLQADYILPHLGIAGLLAAGPDPKLWDGKRAVQLMNKVETLGGQTAQSRRIMGLAHYRAGNWKESLDALEEAMKLAKGGNSSHWFCVAMAHQRLGHNSEARKWYDKAVEWMDKHKPKDEMDELRRFRAEAAKLLSVADETASPTRGKK
jgi:tetratricopeptide (TPR) repeat protein/serine/threonine protein kinase